MLLLWELWWENIDESIMMRCVVVERLRLKNIRYGKWIENLTMKECVIG